MKLQRPEDREGRILNLWANKNAEGSKEDENIELLFKV